MLTSLDEASDELAERTDVRAVVLSGDGPSFCSGLDFPSLMSEPSRMEEIFARRDGDPANLAQRVTYDWQRLPMPVIAALHGNCIGGGAQLALGPDIRIAAPDTRISVLEVKYGLIPDMGLTQTLLTLVGLDVAKELTFTGRFVEAEEALRLGLVTRMAGDPKAAADLFWRAGRSAAAQSDAGTARPWLERALRLTNDDATEQAAEEALAGLP
jgi:enoyl-CoA hydratase/carnithine racemase